MNLKEVLHFADQIVFEKTGQHLDDLQEAVLKGTLQRETYKQIAKDFDCSESRARNAGSQLWQILSKELGEDVSKSNFISAIKRFQNSNFFNFAQNVSRVSGSFNICGQGRHPPDIPKSHRQNQETSHTKQTKTLHHDLSQKPDLADFYGRSSELDTLKTWILQERCRLISLTGISGIGKTQLVVKLLPYLQEHFEYILWYNADQDSTFTEFQADLFALFDPSLQDSFIPPHGKPLKSLIKPLQKHRCLVVLDDIHHLFCRGELAGKYKPELEEYRAFFKQMETLCHSSCFLLIGWESPRELAQIKSQNTPIRTLQITRLDVHSTRQILQDYGLGEIGDQTSFVNRYEGNPLWLKSVATMMTELGMTLTDFPPEDTVLLPEDFRDILQQQYDRISDTEKQILSILINENQPFTLLQFLEQLLDINSSELVNVLQSLQRRCFVEKIDQGFWLSPLIKQYLMTL